MKKIVFLLLLIGLSLTLFAGDHLNHPVYHYNVITTAMDDTDFSGNPDQWGIEGKFVTADPTSSLANIEPGKLTENMISGTGDNLKGMVMNETNWIGNSYMVYLKYYLSADGSADTLYLGVKVWDEVICDHATMTDLGISSFRADAVELRFDPANDAAQVNDGGTGLDCDGGNGYGSYKWAAGLFKNTTVIGQTPGAVTPMDYDYGPGSTGSTGTIWGQAGDAYQDNGYFTGGYYINFKLNMSQADLRDCGSVNKHLYNNHIVSMGLAIVVKDNDLIYENSADMDRVWNSGLHNEDLSCTYAHGADWDVEGQKSDVTCNSPAFWASLEPADSVIEWVLATCSLSGTDLTLDWAAPDFSDFGVTVQGYRIYGSTVWDPTFNVYPDFFYADYAPSYPTASPGDTLWTSRHYYCDADDYTGIANSDVDDEPVNDPVDNPDIGINQHWTKIGNDIGAGTTISTFAYGTYKFFLVTALISDGSDDDLLADEYPIPTEVLGIHQFTLNTQTGTDLNFVGLPYAGSYSTAAELGDAIGLGDGGTISEWDPVNQAWNSSSKLAVIGWVNDFDLSDAPALMIGATSNDVTFTNIGELAQLPQYELIFTAGANQNLIAVPVNSPSVLTDASDILDLSDIHFDGINNHGQTGVGDIAGTVSKWDFASQSWTTYTDGSSGSDFAVSKGDPLSINLFDGVNTLWPVYDNHEDRNCSLTVHE